MEKKITGNFADVAPVYTADYYNKLKAPVAKYLEAIQDLKTCDKHSFSVHQNNGHVIVCVKLNEEVSKEHAVIGDYAKKWNQTATNFPNSFSDENTVKEASGFIPSKLQKANSYSDAVSDFMNANPAMHGTKVGVMSFSFADKEQTVIQVVRGDICTHHSMTEAALVTMATQGGKEIKFADFNRGVLKEPLIENIEVKGAVDVSKEMKKHLVGFVHAIGHDNVVKSLKSVIAVIDPNKDIGAIFPKMANN